MTQDNSGNKPKEVKRTTTKLAGSTALQELQALMNSHPSTGNKSKGVVRTTNAPPPIRPSSGGGSSGVSLQRQHRDCPSADWTEWLHIPVVGLADACALSLNIDPHSVLWERLDRSFSLTTDEDHLEAEFRKRIRILDANIFEHGFSHCPTGEVRLSEFAWWAHSVVEWPNLPTELVALAEPPPSRRATAPPERASDASGDATRQQKVVGDWRAEARTIADELFDHDTKQNTRDCLLRSKGRGGYAVRVMAVMQEREIHGPRGLIDNPNTIAREALQGAKWWSGKHK